MRYIVFFAVMLCVCSLRGAAPPEQRAIPVMALTDSAIIGDLQQPLGTVVRIQCHLVTNPNSGQKSSKSMAAYRLAVTAVNGDPLSRPQIVDFKVSPQSRESIPIHPSPLQFAQSRFAGTKFKSTAEAGRQQAARWLGQPIECLAYETGSFIGHPRYPKDLAPRMIGATRGFHFHRYVVLIHPKDW